MVKQSDAHMAPYGSKALHMLGLSDQVPMRYIYLNDKLHENHFKFLDKWLTYLVPLNQSLYSIVYLANEFNCD